MSKPVITYETAPNQEGEVKAYAVLNKDFIISMRQEGLNRIFGNSSEAISIVMDDEKGDFAFIIDADAFEEQITEAVNLVSEVEPGIVIDTASVENRLGLGTDINITATSLDDIEQKVKGWLATGEFAPNEEQNMEFPS